MELIRITSTDIAGQSVQTVNARDLHAFLGVRKDFSNWVKAQVTRAHLIENEDYAAFAQKGEQEYQGVKTRIDYALTLEAGKHIAMMAGTPKGRQVRAYFIECERRLRAPAEPEQPQLPFPMGIAENDRRAIVGAVTKNISLHSPARPLERSFTNASNLSRMDTTRSCSSSDGTGIMILARLSPDRRFTFARATYLFFCAWNASVWK